MSSSQRPFFLSSFIAAFRPQGPSLPAASTQQNSKHSTQATSNSSASTSSTQLPQQQQQSPQQQAHHHHTHSPAQASRSANVAYQSRGGVAAAAAAAAAANGAIPVPGATPRRRGSDSSSEGFRDAIGADRWYVGGRTAGGEERFFKLGVVRRVRSNDGLSLDRLSL